MTFIKEIKKFLVNLKNIFISTADINKDGKLSKDDIKALKNKTKTELEKIGRKVGVELDRRLTKSKLIKQLRKFNKK